METPAPWEIEQLEWQEIQRHEFRRALSDLVDAYLAKGIDCGVVQYELREILCVDLIARQEGIMEMMGGRHEDEEEDA